MKLIGHGSVIKQLNAMITTQKIPHALIFTGPEGCGKNQCAHHFAYGLMTSQPSFVTNIDDSDPQWCQIKDNYHPDFLCLSTTHLTTTDGRDEFKTSEIDKIGNFLNGHKVSAPWRVIIIDSMANLSPRMANTLLKTIEEPPQLTVIILIAHNSEDVLATIKSRCQIISFEPLLINEVNAILNQHIMDPQHRQVIHRLLHVKCSLKNVLRIVEYQNYDFLQALLDALIAVTQDQPHHYVNLWDSAGKDRDTLSATQKYDLAFQVFMQWFYQLCQTRCKENSDQNVRNSLLIDYWFFAHKYWMQAQPYHLDKKATLTIIVNRVALLLQ